MKKKADPEEYDKVSKLAFAPIYPYLAQRIKEKFGIWEGVCIDVGSGPGSLAIALARITNLAIYSLDIQDRMTEIALRNIAEAHLTSRIRAITADVRKMPFEDGSVDLAVSRGSLPFWEDKVGAFCEIYRVLRPGGVAYIGGGFGTEEIKASVMKAFYDNEALKGSREKFLEGMKRQKLTPKGLQADLAKSAIPGTVELENCGIWVQIIKPMGLP
jgi:ubiquinone/menaquinone biosynthesis C-methylase UbiE